MGENDWDISPSELFHEGNDGTDGHLSCADEPETPTEGMTLAEALSLRGSLQKKIQQVSSRLKSNAKVQEGEQPDEDPMRLIAVLDANIKALYPLICRINKTNSQTVVDGVSVTELLAKRDTLALECSVLRGFLSEASSRIDRYSKNEIKILPSVKVADIQKSVDRLSKELRELDVKLQRINWTTVLL